MNIIRASYQIMKPDLDAPDAAMKVYQDIEESGRVCYQSEAAMTEESGEKFVRTMVRNGHDAMLEHTTMKVRFTVDRGVSHELVRHRLCSFAQESTRYCNYSKNKFGNEITVIEPCFFRSIPENVRMDLQKMLPGELVMNEACRSDICTQYSIWLNSCRQAEKAYFNLLLLGATPQEARTVLPNSLKTTIDVTADMREWRNIFKLRAAGEHGTPHPQMLEVMVPLRNECRMKLPALFDDIQPMEES